jgi:hypothetical protein
MVRLASSDFSESEDPTIRLEERAKAQYYMYSILLITRGVRLYDDPTIDEEMSVWRKSVYDWGAKLAAADFLADAPDHPVARRILMRGVDAPTDVHQAFFLQCTAPTVFRFMKKHSPPPSDPRPSQDGR